jgi:hypothetical protein
MTETRHTPGPWKYFTAYQDNGPNYILVATAAFKGKTIATLDIDSEADASLIIAAPDQAARITELEKQLDQLLEAAYSIQNLQGVCWAGSNLPAYEGLDVQYHWDKLRAAIKACEVE